VVNLPPSLRLTSNSFRSEAGGRLNGTTRSWNCSCTFVHLSRLARVSTLTRRQISYSLSHRAL
jgi:hypothetical protein